MAEGAQGNPWIFREIKHFLTTGNKLSLPNRSEVQNTLLEHLDNLYAFYGEYMGPRIARKHIAWYMKNQPDFKTFKQQLFAIDDATQQRQAIHTFFEHRFAEQSSKELVA